MKENIYQAFKDEVLVMNDKLSECKQREKTLSEVIAEQKKTIKQYEGKTRNLKKALRELDDLGHLDQTQRIVELQDLLEESHTLNFYLQSRLGVENLKNPSQKEYN